MSAIERLTAALDRVPARPPYQAYAHVKRDDLAAVLAVVAAAQLPRNVAIHDEDTARRFKGEWVAVPRKDFDALRAALARLEQPRREYLSDADYDVQIATEQP